MCPPSTRAAAELTAPHPGRNHSAAERTNASGIRDEFRVGLGMSGVGHGGPQVPMHLIPIDHNCFFMQGIITSSKAEPSIFQCWQFEVDETVDILSLPCCPSTMTVAAGIGHVTRYATACHSHVNGTEIQGIA